MTGCYLSGVGDGKRQCGRRCFMQAIVTPLSQAVTNATVANVVFVVEVGYLIYRIFERSF